jgi:hypothetical protein
MPGERRLHCGRALRYTGADLVGEHDGLLLEITFPSGAS